jgi:hypothetical protein
LLDLYSDIHAAAGRPFSFPPDFVSTARAHKARQAESVL